MKKSDKKLEKLLVNSLTDVCENTMKAINGFEWLTHHVNYNKFPESLMVLCVFSNLRTLNSFLMAHNKNEITNKIVSHLRNDVGVKNFSQKGIEYLTEDTYSKRYVNNSYH